ncbi:hypothetical protein TWF730_007055 [Orbilia blumenaviensis]|uniref:Peptidase A1 domain-containing protein n=1 Tax=Orbilia blumenaviensis TaxID=1796055 RepID=A0AAV9VMC1_9PEZI
MRITYALLPLFAASLPLVYALNCSADPVALPFGNITLGKDTARPHALGVPLILGRQYFAATIDARYSTLFVNSVPKTCTNAKTIPEDCADNGGQEVRVGGFFDGGLSETYTGPSFENLQPHPGLYGITSLNKSSDVHDVLRLGESDTGPYIGNFTFRTHQQDYYRLVQDRNSPTLMGLDKDSTILEYVLDSNITASKVWSFFGGWHGITQESSQEGQLVLGGYDRSKVDGDFINFPMSDYKDDLDPELEGCLMQVVVKGLTFSHSGRSFNIYKDSVGYRSCINPSLSTVGISGYNPAYAKVGHSTGVQNFMKTLGQMFVTHYEEIRLPSSIYFDYWVKADRTNRTLMGILETSSLTIQLDRINFTIPGHQLITLDRKATLQGWELADDAHNTTYIPINDSIMLGLPFLSAAVLAVNYENYTFSLARAITEKTDKKQNDLVPLKSELCNPPPAAPSLPEDPVVEDPDRVEPERPADATGSSGGNDSKALTRKEIAGIAIGISSAVLIACIGVFLVYRRRKAQKRLLAPPSPPNTKGYHEKDGQELFEMPGDQTFTRVTRPRMPFLRRATTFFS